MNTNVMEIYNNYSMGKISLREIPLDKLNNYVLIKAARTEQKNFIEVFFELYKNNLFDKVGLSFEQCLSLILDEYKNKEFYDRLFNINPEYSLKFIPKLYHSQEMYRIIYASDPVKYFNNLPKQYKNQEMCNEYFLKYPSKCFEFIPIEFKTQDMCNRYFEFDHRNNFKVVPIRFRTKDMCEKFLATNPTDREKFLIPDEFKTYDIWKLAVSKTDNWKIIFRIPDGMLSQELCDMIFEMNQVESFFHIPNRFKSSSMCLKASLNASDSEILKHIPSEKITQDICDIVFDKDNVLAFYRIPDIFKTEVMCVIAAMSFDDINILKKIPRNILNQRICDIVFERYYEKCFVDIPEEFRTRDMYIYLLKENFVKYIDCVPEKVHDSDLYAIAMLELKKLMEQRKTINTDSFLCRNVIQLYPYLIKALSRGKRDEIINEDLYALTINGGTISGIALKYELDIDTVRNVLERMKENNLEMYTSIKKVLDSNQKKFYVGMMLDIKKLGMIISSLGSLNGQTLSAEQKIKFSYLCHKCIYNPLEEIYSYNKRHNIDTDNNINNEEKNEYMMLSKKINVFFRRFLKYNFVICDGVTIIDIPERNTIIFNNSWLKRYDREKFFAIRDGVPTAEKRYGKNASLLTFEIEEYVISELNRFDIPLIDVIVQGAFREYFNGNLDGYLSKFQEYNELIIDINGKRKDRE